MSLNPFDPPSHVEGTSERTARIAGWWIAIPYLMPLLIVITMLNEAGWYGTGSFGFFLGVFRIAVFLVGLGCACYVLIYGSMKQRFAAAPAALAYTALALGILWDNYL